MHIYHKRRRRDPKIRQLTVQKIDRRQAKINKLRARPPCELTRILIEAQEREIAELLRIDRQLFEAGVGSFRAKTLLKLQTRVKPPDRRLKAYRDAKAAGKPVDPLADLREALAVQLAAVPWPAAPTEPPTEPLDDRAAFLAEIRAAAIADGVAAEDLAPEAAAR